MNHILFSLRMDGLAVKSSFFWESRIGNWLPFPFFIGH